MSEQKLRFLSEINTLPCQLRISAAKNPPLGKQAATKSSEPIFPPLVSFLYLSFLPNTKPTTLLRSLKLIGFFFQCFIVGRRRNSSNVLAIITTDKSTNTQTPVLYTNNYFLKLLILVLQSNNTILHMLAVGMVTYHFITLEPSLHSFPSNTPSSPQFHLLLTLEHSDQTGQNNQIN